MNTIMKRIACPATLGVVVTALALAPVPVAAAAVPCVESSIESICHTPGNVQINDRRPVLAKPQYLQFLFPADSPVITNHH